MKKKIYPDLSIVMIGHVDHGKTTVVQSLTGKWVDTYSEEIKRGITIKLGYADFTIYKDPSKKEPECYTTKPCENCEPIKKISIVDAPGHEALISTMLSGAAIVDAGILVIAANEPCPQPQTKEHLMAFKLLGDKPIIVVQNKIDLVTKEQALENYKQIRKFLEDFGYNPDEIDIIPISALHNVNIDILLEALAKLPVPKRDLESDPIFLVSRSFDVNKPGTPIEKLVGGVLGGSLLKGKLKVGQEIEIRPGIYTEEGWEPLYTYIESINQGGYFVEEARPGGTVGIATTLDPSLTKEDNLAGQVVGLPGKLPPEWKDVTLEIHLFEKVIGTEKEMKVEPIKFGEELMLNAYSIVSIGKVIDVRKDEITVRLLKPILGYEGDRVVVSRKIRGRWRIIGYGNIK